MCYSFKIISVSLLYSIFFYICVHVRNEIKRMNVDLLYKDEHCNCFNYEHEGSGVVEIYRLKKNVKIDINPNYHKVLFVREGFISFKKTGHSEKKMNPGNMLLIQSEEHISVRAVTDTVMVSIRIPIEKQLCDTYSFERLLSEVKAEKRRENGQILPINIRIQYYLDFLIECTTDGLRCTHYFDLKTKEFLFLLRAYYTKKDLYHFFHPLLTNDITFSQLIIQNSNRVKTVQELADLTNYSLSGFQKRFKKAFGISAHQWLNTQRAKSILHDISNSKLSLKEICYNYGFSSQSYFNDFCKTNLGCTPGQLRNKKK